MSVSTTTFIADVAGFILPKGWPGSSSRSPVRVAFESDFETQKAFHVIKLDGVVEDIFFPKSKVTVRNQYGIVPKPPAAPASSDLFEFFQKASH